MNDIKKDPLSDLFKLLPADHLSSGFRDKMMAEIMKESLHLRKRNHFWSIVGIVFAAICLVTTTILCAMYINWSFLQEIGLEIDKNTWKLPAFSFYTYLFIIVGVLLALDFLFRKHYKKRMGGLGKISK